MQDLHQAPAQVRLKADVDPAHALDRCDEDEHHVELADQLRDQYVKTNELRCGPETAVGVHFGRTQETVACEFGQNDPDA